MSQPQAIFYSFVLPVVLLMIFNLFALRHTVIHIVITRKVRKIAKLIFLDSESEKILL